MSPQVSPNWDKLVGNETLISIGWLLVAIVGSAIQNRQAVFACLL